MSTDQSRGFPANVLSLARRFLESRYLGSLSEDKRDRLREQFDVVRRTILHRRPPRIAVVGTEEVDLRPLLAAIVGDALPDELDIKEQLGRGRWYDYEVRGVGLEILDLRPSDDQWPVLEAVERQPPDIVLFPRDFQATTETSDRALERLADVVELSKRSSDQPPHLIALVDRGRLPDDTTARRAERRLREELREVGVWGAESRVLQRQDVRSLDRELVDMAPLEARMPLARAVQTADSKRRLARSIIQSSAGLTAAIATIPLPFADIVPITAVQMAMIGAIGHVSGRRFSVKTVGEFAAAIGVNVGAGYAVREIARALVQFVPFAGSVVSSGIAAGATYALGNAAATYFIEDLDGFDATPEQVEQADVVDIGTAG